LPTIPILLMPFWLREILSIPQGDLVSSKKGFVRNVEADASIGDIVSETVDSPLKVVDAKTKREFIGLKESNRTSFKVFNPRGSVSLNAFSIITHISENKVFVYGEEDLLVLPTLMNPHIQTCVYGQPNVGIVIVKNTEFTRMRMREILKTFKPVMYAYSPKEMDRGYPGN